MSEARRTKPGKTDGSDQEGSGDEDCSQVTRLFVNRMERLERLADEFEARGRGRNGFIGARPAATDLRSIVADALRQLDSIQPAVPVPSNPSQLASDEDDASKEPRSCVSGARASEENRKQLQELRDWIKRQIKSVDRLKEEDASRLNSARLSGISQAYLYTLERIDLITQEKGGE